jgi:hypothetical protein
MRVDRGNQLSTGKRNKLDAEQEVAFEVLTATYVLTFNDEANDNLDDQALNSSRTRTAFWNWQDETHDKQRISLCECLLQDLPELANVAQQYYSVLLVTIVSDDANQSILFSQIIRGGSACKTLQSKYQPSFQQADRFVLQQ